MATSGLYAELYEAQRLAEEQSPDYSQKAQTTHTRLIVTCFARSSVPGGNPTMGLVSNLKVGPQIKQVQCLDLTPHIFQSVYTLPNDAAGNLSTLRHEPVTVESEMANGCEYIFDLLPNPPFYSHRPIRLALFDMDSTLINEEVIDELAASIGIADAVSAITARAMNGEIDFATSLKERVSMLRGVPTTVWEKLKETVTIANGARDFIKGLKSEGVFTGVVSGGFMPMAEWLKDELGLDVAVANHLLVEETPTTKIPHPHLSGLLDLSYPLVTPELKRSILLSLAAEHSIPLSETLAVGDGSNDLLMLGNAGLGIAWNAKEKVQAMAPQRLNWGSLADLLYLFGWGKLPEPEHA
ncbi:hypothetical protein MMC28_010890 [Mycoblastus sanguinarius]|nr:hypothetical protein [Mycoblastus sanguinarius]